MLKFCLLLLVSSSSGHIFENDQPKNKAVMEGDDIELHCTTTHPGRGIIWTYQREDFIDEVIHPLNFEDTIFGKRLRVIKSFILHTWDFILKIKNVKLYDAGIFTCINGFSGKKMSALVNVMRKPNCSSRHTHIRITYECMLQFNTYLEIVDQWICNVPEETNREVSSKSLSELDHPETGVTIAFNELISSSTLRKTQTGYESFILLCNLSVKSNFDDFMLPGWATNLDSEMAPFGMNLAPLSHVRFNISSGYNLVVDEPIVCTGDSELDITYHIITSDKEFITGNLARFSYSNRTISIICYAKTDLNLEPVRHEIRDVTIHESYPLSTCSAVGLDQCYLNYFKYIDENDIFVRISQAHYSDVCADNYQNTFDCVRKVLPCYMSERDVGVLQSYIHLCQKSYMTFRKHFLSVPLKWDCKRMYIQQLALVSFLNKADKFKKSSGFIKSNPPKLSDIMRSSCNRIADEIDIHCSSIAVKIYGSIEASKWHSEFFARLRYQKVNDPEAVQSLYKHVNQIRMFEERCNFKRLSEEEQKACDESSKCFNIWQLLLSITDFGIIFIANLTEFEDIICHFDSNFIQSCVDDYLSYCPPKSRVILEPLAVLHRLLCFDYRKAYQLYHLCYKNIYMTLKFKEGLDCTITAMTKFQQIYDEMDEVKKSKLLPEEETELCNIALDYLDCMQSFFTTSCGVEAALLQRIFARLILAEGFKDFYCYFVFSHRSEFLTTYFSTGFYNLPNKKYFAMLYSLLLFMKKNIFEFKR